MKLTKTALLAHQLNKDNLPVISEVFPFHVLDGLDTSRFRSRVFDPQTTILTMVLSALHSDKSLKNSVLTYQRIHQQKAHRLQQRQGAAPKISSTRGIKSKLKPISSNTSAYSQARSRVPLQWFSSVFTASRQMTSPQSLWHGYTSFSTDGTYLQMQDTPQLRASFDVKRQDPQYESSYPEALLQVVRNHDTGGVHSYRLGNRHLSELELCYSLLDDIP